MTSPKVRSHARHAPLPVPVRDELQHISAPLVVQVAWSAQRQRWVWFEYLDEIEDLIEQPLCGTVEIRDPAVDGVLAMHEGGTAYGQLSRKRRSQTEVRDVHRGVVGVPRVAAARDGARRLAWFG